MRKRSGHAAVALVLVASVVAACGTGGDVETERATPISDEVDTAVEPPIASAPTTASDPTTASVPTTGPAVPTTGVEPGDVEPGDVETGLGDSLFPELGAPGVDVLEYDVLLDIDPALGSFDAEIGIVADVDPRLPVLALDADGLTIDSVEVDGEPTAFEQVASELLIDLPTGRSRTVDVVVSYTASPDETTSAVGLPAGWFRTESGSYVLNEPDGARRWLPSNDHPSDKARWRFELTVPDGLAAVANGTLIQRGTAVSPWVWELDEPMPTYLVLLAVGDYEVVVDEPYVSSDGDTIPIVHVVPAGDRAAYEPYFDLTAPQLEFFERLLGPYPLDAYGLAFVDSVPGLAMETQGRSLFSVSDFTPTRLDTLQHLLLAHELVHQWFGNAVSPADWGDIWLNESFATYFQWIWMEEAGLTTVDREASRSLAGRQNGEHSTGDPVLETMFGFESYDGGAVVVHALRLTIGDDDFFALVQRWVAEYVGTAQDTESFERMAEEVSGEDLSAFFRAWLDATDLPDRFPD